MRVSRCLIVKPKKLRKLTDIDSELINELLQLDKFRSIGKEAPIRRVAGVRIIDYDTEVDIDENRTADILLIVQVESEQYRLVVEVENDRKKDINEILRKIQRGKRYPTKLIIPKKFERDAKRFQKKGIPVWYWTGIFKWLCRDSECSKKTTSASSLTPIRCIHCKKQGTLEWDSMEKVEFTPAENNPEINYKEYQIQVSTVNVPW